MKRGPISTILVGVFQRDSASASPCPPWAHARVERRMRERIKRIPARNPVIIHVLLDVSVTVILYT